MNKIYKCIKMKNRNVFYQNTNTSYMAEVKKALVESAGFLYSVLKLKPVGQDLQDTGYANNFDFSLNSNDQIR